MKKVLYVITSPAHKRVFESFTEHPELDQLVIGPPPVASKMIPEDYSDFKLKNIQYYSNKNYAAEISAVVSRFKPDIYVQADLIPAHNVVKINAKYNFKRVYVSHGLIGNHVISIIKQAGFNTSVWKGLDLYCGAADSFAEWIKHVTGVADDKILLNAVPQFDILCDTKYIMQYKSNLLANIGITPNKVLLFIGFNGKDRFDFDDHNEDYFKTSIELGKIATKNNWLVMIKPRQTHSEIMKFLRLKKWGVKYIKEYESLHNNRNVYFINAASTHIYRYYFADAFIINGCSTAEVEVCAIQKPLVVVRTEKKPKIKNYDPFLTATSGAGFLVDDINSLQTVIEHSFAHNGLKQVELLKKMGITFDGKMYERIQNKFLSM